DFLFHWRKQRGLINAFQIRVTFLHHWRDLVVSEDRDLLLGVGEVAEAVIEMEVRIDGPSKRNFTRRRRVLGARASPKAPPASESRALSVRSWRTRRILLAPSAVRMASSRSTLR